MDGPSPTSGKKKPSNILERLVSDGYLGGFQQGFARGFTQGFREGSDDARRTTLLALAGELLGADEASALEAIEADDALQASLVERLRARQ